MNPFGLMQGVWGDDDWYAPHDGNCGDTRICFYMHFYDNVIPLFP